MHRTAKKVRTKEELLEKAKIVLDNPELRLLILNAHYAEPDRVVPMIRELVKDFVSKPKVAAGLRHAAMLVRDYPETIRLFTHPNESEKPMNDTMVGQKVLTAAHLYTGERLPFTWGDLLCELTVLRDQNSMGLNFIKDSGTTTEASTSDLLSITSGFAIRVSFPFRRVDELIGPLNRLADKTAAFLISGVRVSPRISTYHPAFIFSYQEMSHTTRECAYSVESRLRKNYVEAMKEEIAHLEFHFSCGCAHIDPKKIHFLREEKFRNAYMLACIHHEFGIPTEVIEYEPVAEEESEHDPATAFDVSLTEDQVQAFEEAVDSMQGLSTFGKQFVVWLVRLSLYSRLPVCVIVDSNDYYNECELLRFDVPKCYREGILNIVLRAMGYPYHLHYTWDGSALYVALSAGSLPNENASRNQLAFDIQKIREVDIRR